MPGSDANGLGMFIFINAHMYTYISYHPQYYHSIEIERNIYIYIYTGS
jgi:hypothetical protein